MDFGGSLLRLPKDPTSLTGLIGLRPVREGKGLSGEIVITPRDLSHQRLLEGIAAEKSLSRVRLLFTLCRTAQTSLASEALGHAETHPPCQKIRKEKEWKVLKESLLESLRTVLTPPGSSFSPTDRIWDNFRALLTELPNENPDIPFWKNFREICDRNVFGEPSSHFGKMNSPRDWDRWAGKEVGATPVSLLARNLIKETRIGDFHFPPVTIQEVSKFSKLLLKNLPHDRFLTHPHLGGTFYETGSKARMGSHPLVISLESARRPLASRLASRLLELSAWAEEGPLMADKSPLFGIHSKSPTEGTGIAWTETARGVLIHHVTLSNGQTESYRILAPTEWTFHPEGGPFKLWSKQYSEFLSSEPAEEPSEEDRRWPWLDLALWIFDPCTLVRFLDGEKAVSNTCEILSQ